MDIILSALLIVLTLSLTFIPMTGDLWLKQKTKSKTKTKILWRGYLFTSLAFLAVLLGIIQVVRSANAQTQILENTKQITGGDSFCRMDIGNINSNNDKGYLIFSVEGKYPLNRISVFIWDLNVPDSVNLSVSDIFKNAYSLGTIDPGIAAVTQKSIQLDKIKGVNLNLQLSANNGATHQSIRMRFVNGKWVRATQITPFGSAKELLVKIDPDYPIQDKEIIFK